MCTVAYWVCQNMAQAGKPSLDGYLCSGDVMKQHCSLRGKLTYIENCQITPKIKIFSFLMFKMGVLGDD